MTVGRLSIGRVVERYRVEELLGEGGTAAVYRVRHVHLGTDHALKVLTLVGAQAAPRLLLEGRIQAALRHPNILAVTDVIEVDGSWGLLLEYVPPPTLATLLAERRLDLVEAEALFRGIVAGVAHAHRHGLVHRDLKPHNVLLAEGGRLPKVADFGLARLLEPGDDARHTRSGAPMGTPAYMAPEQFRDARGADRRADVFSLGCILQELVTGEPAFAWTDMMRVYADMMDRRSMPLPDEVPARLQEAIRACLEPEPDERIPDCDALLSRLDGGESPARPTVPAPPLPPIPPRPPRPASPAPSAAPPSRGPDTWSGDAPAAVAAPVSSLPPERVAFVGRVEELGAVADAFDAGTRVLTLIGTGGVGKSHLARRAGAAALARFPGGVWFVPLADVHTALGVAGAVGRVLGIPLEQGEAVAVLGAALGGREPTLVILDNFEQLVGLAEETVGRWIDAAPDTRWIVTSRTRLGLRGEQLLPVEPLPVPAADAPTDTLLQSAAIQLFLDRARTFQPGFSPDEATLRDIAALVQQLDGLPLAVELAAARVRMLTPRRILERLGRRFDLLKGGPGGPGALRAAIDGSWALLEPWGRAALAQAAVFEGGFGLEAAEAVIDLGEWADAPWPMDALQVLVDQSLVRAGVHAEDTRFSLLRSIRDYAAEKLEESGGAGAARDRHAAWFARAGGDDARTALRRSGGTLLRRALEADLDNLCAATRHAARTGDGETAARAALGAVSVLEVTGPFALALELGEAALAAHPPEGLANTLRVAVAVVQGRAGQPAAAEPALVAALDNARAAGDRRLEASALAALGAGDLARTALEEAQGRYEAALALRRALGDAHGEADCLLELAHVVGIRGGRLAEGHAHAAGALARFKRLGDQGGEALAQSYLGALHGIGGDHAAGRAAYERARTLARRVGDRRTEALCEGMIAAIACNVGAHDEARVHFERALTMSRRMGDTVHEAMHAANYGASLARRGDPAEAAEHFERVVTLARQHGDPLLEGIALGELGALRVGAGALGEGRGLLAKGEARLRAAGDPAELAKLLCKAGGADLEAGDRAAAEARLAEARALADGIGVGAGSELAEAIAGLASWLR